MATSLLQHACIAAKLHVIRKWWVLSLTFCVLCGFAKFNKVWQLDLIARLLSWAALRATHMSGNVATSSLCVWPMGLHAIFDGKVDGILTCNAK